MGPAAGARDPQDFGIEWNAENQLTRVTKGAVEVTRFVYDPLGRRVEKVAGATTTSYAYDSEDILREGTGGTTVRYVHGPGIDEPLAVQAAVGQLAYGHADVLGSDLRRTDSSGAVVLSRSYETFGRPGAGAALAGYAFGGREYDQGSDLMYYRARYYSAGEGRFLSEDPIGFRGGINFYAYARNNPVNVQDPLGLEPSDSCSCPCRSGNWSVQPMGGGSFGAALGPWGFGSSVTYGTIQCYENPSSRRRVKITCRVTGGVFLGAGVGVSASSTTVPDVSDQHCGENLPPFSTREKLFSVFVFGGTAPAGDRWPSSFGIGKSFGIGAASVECYYEAF